MNEDERKLAADLGIESDDEDLDHMIRSSNQFKKPLMPKKESVTPQQNTNFLDFLVKKNSGDSFTPLDIVATKTTSVSP